MQSTRTCTIDGCDRSIRARSVCIHHYEQLRKAGNLPPKSEKFNVAKRFWAKVDKQGPVPTHAPQLGPCWEWTASRWKQGYGKFKLNGRNQYAHRVLYVWKNGTLPCSVQLDHMCHNPCCVNPEHLRETTCKQNTENYSGMQSRNTSGYRGVHQSPHSGKWVARVMHNGKRHFLGQFNTPEEAGDVARKARLELFTHNDLDKLADRKQRGAISGSGDHR